MDDQNPMETTQYESGSVAKFLSIIFCLIGVAVFIGGIVLAKDDFDFNWGYFLGGIVAAIFNFGWAVVMRVCAFYLREHDNG